MPTKTVPANSADAVKRLLVTSHMYSEEAGIDDTTVHYQYITGYRRALVFRVTISNASDTKTFFAKVGVNLSDGVRAFVAKEAKMTKAVFQRFPQTPELGVVEPAYYFPEQAVFATKSMSGTRLDHELLAALRWPTKYRTERALELLEKCAGWLQTFQNSWPLDGSLKQGDLLIGIRRQLQRLSDARPALFPPTLVSTVENVAETMASKLGKDAYQPVMRHDDFAPWNIIANNDQIVVYDFPNVQPGSLHYDRYYFDQALSSFGNKPFVNKRQLDRFRRHFASSLKETATKPVAEHRFFSIYFSLVRLGSLEFMRSPRFPLSILGRVRVAHEMQRLKALCEERD